MAATIVESYYFGSDSMIPIKDPTFPLLKNLN